MPERVLIIDDEENIRQMLRLTLETADYEVGEAGDGMETFAILGGDPAWNVILLDQRLPIMEGTEVLRRIKVLAPQARVVMMTAFASIELAVQAMKLGATDFLRKPLTPEMVRNAVAAALKRVSGGAEGQDVETRSVTMNGFTILSSADIANPNERRFTVRKPNGRDQEVVVEITPEARESAERMMSGATVDEDIFTFQAEIFLSDFIWNDGDVPRNRRLVLKRIDGNLLEQTSPQERKK
ncbi:MAG TPA: response regulator [Pyrinomonadaceae bacterium]|nr:response regulator [Pyrinomonadaceae bacterium]